MIDLLKQYTLEEVIILFSTPFYLVLIGIEAFISHWRHHNYYSIKDVAINTIFMLFNGSIDLLFRGIYLGILAYVFSISPFTPIANPWVYWIVLFVLEDFVFYWLHYFDHRSRLFWAVHVTHHSSEYFNLTTGFRSSVFQPLYRFIYFLPIAYLGFSPVDIVLMYSITQIYGIIIHTKLVDKLGFLEHIIVTPSHHRVHHASNVLYLDKNMGMCLIIWDKLFGTFQEEIPSTPVRYGLTTPLEKQTIPHSIFHEWIAICKDLSQPISIIDKIKYLLNPPGWSHDGSRKTATELQQELLNNQSVATRVENPEIKV